MRSRAEVDAELARLEALLPGLIRAHGEAVLEAFAGEAERLENSISDEELARHARSRITCMLASAGLIPGDNEGEACV